jgi:hypothetical protein
MAVLNISAPSVQVDCPDDWTVDMNLKAALPCWAVLRGPTINDFLVNVVVKVDRINAEISVDSIAAEMTEALFSQYSNGHVRNNRSITGRVDQVVEFTASGIGLVQYQRFTVVESTGGVHWLISLEGTCSAETEEAVKPQLVSVFESCQIISQ